MVLPIVGGNESKGYEISNSLRFNDGDSPDLRLALGSSASGSNTNSNDESISLISRLSSNVKEKAINVGSKAISMVSEVANKSLENKFMKKDEIEDIKSNDFSLKERVEPSFMGLENNEENKLNAIDNTTMQDTDYNNIPSFLKRNRD